MKVILVHKRTLLVAGAILLAAVALVALILFLGRDRDVETLAGVAEYELTVLAGKQRELPVYSVARDDKKIALTIDAAWEDDKTEFILSTLKRYDVKATFFLCGVWVKSYPEQVKAIAEAGHEIGNHSKTHPHMNKLDTAGIQKEIMDLEAEIEALTGARSKVFRAPFGEYNDTVVMATRAIGMEIVQWNIDTMGDGWNVRMATDEACVPCSV